ncbi:hypothetical protein [Sinomonas halotolerans]|uniref:Uncharacterized protein n=1 Tax=Sinomonas halotolerans TaxID=1644133 RepID=A0ABU9X1D5_9MICC
MSGAGTDGGAAGTEDAAAGGVDPAADLREVLGTALGLAQEHLEQNGGFLPFGVTLAHDGELRLVMVAPPEAGAGGDIDADAMMADVLELLRQNRADCRAVAFASDVHLPEHGAGGADGIHAAAEHAAGGVMAAVVPYGKTDAGFAFSPLEPDGHEPEVFTD